jgi:hypothetical protein
MALTYEVLNENVVGNTRRNLVRITGDNAYGAGGYTLDAESCGMHGRTIAFAQFLGAAEGAGAAFTGQWDYLNKKLKLHDGAAAAANFPEVAAGDPNAVKILVEVVSEPATGP